MRDMMIVVGIICALAGLALSLYDIREALDENKDKK